MGTDAVALVEVRLEGEWMPALMPMWPNPEYNPQSEDEVERTEYTLYPILPREYGMFSVLANVRNRGGTGAVHKMSRTLPSGFVQEFDYDTDDGGHAHLKYIADARGIPDDASEPWKEFFGERTELHDHTYLTLQELIDGPWQQQVRLDGYLLEEDYRKFRADGVRPEYSARGAGGPGVLMVSEEEYLEGKRGEASTAILTEWDGGTVQSRNAYFGVYLRIMMMIAVNDDYDSVRLMVAFES